MKRLFDKKEACFGCGSCSAACKEGAITMQRDEEGFFYPVIDSSCCIECGSCEKVCPAKHPLGTGESRFYAVRCHDLQLLQKSTSGGAFSLLAQEVIETGGLVCGACFDKDFHVCHVLSENINGMRKSKYVQSDIGDCFALIWNAVAEGRQVLFSGTPCQCHALKLFLGEKREKVIIMSLVCRGVLSPGLWEEYVAWLSMSGTLQSYDFRNKYFLNDGHTVAYTIEGKETVALWQEDKLSRIYSKCIAYRPSCYVCPYCNPENDFDFTIGDFWGIERICPELADGKGTSLVIARGDNAEMLIKKIATKAEIISCKKVEVMQPALESPSKSSMLRKFLFNDFKKKDLQEHCDISLILKKYGV